MDWIDREDFNPSSTYRVSAADALADLDFDEQFDAIVGEFRKPKKLETVRRKMMTYWRVICQWQDDRPDLFDRIFYEYVAEIDARAASEPGGSR